jgi:hypothetical protein
MLEILAICAINGDDTNTVGSGQDFANGVQIKCTASGPGQVVGTASATKCGYVQGRQADITKEPKVMLFDDFDGRAEGIHLMIGRRPYAEFGNSTAATSRCWSGTRRPSQ